MRWWQQASSARRRARASSSIKIGIEEQSRRERGQVMRSADTVINDYDCRKGDMERDRGKKKKQR
jgi:hypothetical protein